MNRIRRGSRAAATKTGHEGLDELLVLVEGMKEFVPDDHVIEAYAVLGRMEEITREVGEEIENYDEEPYLQLRDVAADYLRGLADEDDLRVVLNENGVMVPA